MHDVIRVKSLCWKPRGTNNAVCEKKKYQKSRDLVPVILRKYLSTLCLKIGPRQNVVENQSELSFVYIVLHRRRRFWDFDATRV